MFEGVGIQEVGIVGILVFLILRMVLDFITKFRAPEHRKDRCSWEVKALVDQQKILVTKIEGLEKLLWKLTNGSGRQ